MEDNKSPIVQAETEQARDQELFDAIGKGRKRKKIRRIVITLVILALLAGGIYAAVIYGRKKVREQVGSLPSATSVLGYTVNTGSVNTTVSGSGQLDDVGTEALTLPKGVKVEKLLVAAGDRVAKGDLLATVDRSSVIAAMSEVQKSINELDKKLRTAVNDAVAPNITAGVNGRIKAIYAQAGDDVAAVMAEHGCLALLSMDGYMAVDIPAGELTEGREVTVRLTSGKDLKGKVDLVSGDTAVVLLTDNGTLLDEEVQVLSGEELLGSGKLYIHNPLRITGYAGTISAVAVKENAAVTAAAAVFRLKDTNYSVNYDSYLRERRTLEEDLLELIDISRAGAFRAPFDGTVSSVEYKEPGSTESSKPSGGDEESAEDYYDEYADSMGEEEEESSAGGGTDDSGTGGAGEAQNGLVTLSPDLEMSLTISVDETDILALELGQTAQVTINSIGEMFTGTVTEIDRAATGQSGVTSYSAVITMPKDPRMMSGMSAKAVVRIQGVAGAILIPEAALHQTRDASFVYTDYNYETKEFGGAVSVTAGLSDGSMVEITEGLKEGDTVYYSVTVDPWAMMYGTGGNASGGDVWVDTGEGAFVMEDGASAGDAAGFEVYEDEDGSEESEEFVEDDEFVG